MARSTCDPWKLSDMQVSKGNHVQLKFDVSRMTFSEIENSDII